MPDAAMDPMTLAMLSGSPDALETMRKYALAQQLQQMSLGGAQQPQQLGLEGKYPHAARVGPISAAAPLIQAFMAKKGFETAGPAMSNLMSQAYGLGPSGGQQPQTPQAPVPSQGGGAPPAPVSPQAAPQGPSQAPPEAWYSIPGLPDNAARLMAITNRAEWAKLKLGPDSWQQLVRGYNGNTAMAGQAVQAKAQAEAFKDVRPGSTGINFMTGESMTAADPSRGEQYVPAPGGGIQAVPILGSSDIQAARAGATKGAQESVTPHYEPDPFHPGTSHIVYPPGSPNTPSQGSPAPNKYFPPSGGGTAANLEQMTAGAKSGQAYSDQLNTNAENATELRASLAELRNLAKSGGVSASNPAKVELGSYLIAAGMDPQTVGSMLHTDVGALVAASKQTGSLAINSIHKFTSRGSNFDLATFMKYNPNLDMGSQQGFQRTVDFMDKRLQQDVAKQADFDNWSQNQPPNRWASGHTAHWISLQNKLINMGATNSGAPPITNEAIQAELQRRRSQAGQ